MMRHTIMGAAAALAIVAAGMPGGAALADAKVLQAAACFPQGSFFAKRFEAFVDTVNDRGKDVVQLNYVGGAPAIGSPFTLVQKVAQGVYDITSCTGAYYQNVVPEADAWKLLERTPAEIRENGGWALMTEIHRAQNLVPLARFNYGMPFQLYLGEGHRIEKPDLSGLHLRVAPIYTNFFKSLGATTQTSNLDQVYTLMENGTVAGYGWPITGLRPGWEKVTKYRVDPGFYDVDLELIANARAWDGLSQDARDIIEAAALEYEKQAVIEDAKAADASREKQAGEFEIITFTGEDAAAWLQAARDTGWAGVVESSPQNGPKLRELFAKQ